MRNHGAAHTIQPRLEVGPKHVLRRGEYLLEAGGELARAFRVHGVIAGGVKRFPRAKAREHPMPRVGNAGLENREMHRDGVLRIVIAFHASQKAFVLLRSAGAEELRLAVDIAFGETGILVLGHRGNAQLDQRVGELEHNLRQARVAKKLLPHHQVCLACGAVSRAGGRLVRYQLAQLVQNLGRVFHAAHRGVQAAERRQPRFGAKRERVRLCSANSRWLRRSANGVGPVRSRPVNPGHAVLGQVLRARFEPRPRQVREDEVRTLLGDERLEEVRRVQVLQRDGKHPNPVPKVRRLR